MSKNYIAVKVPPKEESVSSSDVISGEHHIDGDIGGLAGALAKCQGEFTAVKKGKEVSKEIDSKVKLLSEIQKISYVSNVKVIDGTNSVEI